MSETILANKHVGDVLLEEYLKPNKIKPMEMSRAMGMNSNMFYAILHQNQMPNVHWFTMVSELTKTPVSYWTDIHSKWLEEQTQIIKPNIRDRIMFEGKKLSPHYRYLKFSPFEESFFGHGVNVPHKPNRRDPNDKKRNKRGVDYDLNKSLIKKDLDSLSVNSIFKGMVQ